MKKITYIPSFGNCQVISKMSLVPKSAHYCGTEYDEDDYEYSVYDDSNTFYAVLT